MIDSTQLRDLVIRPVLQHLELWSLSAERLVLGTAAQESHMGSYIKQIKGPALGIFQMEPATHDSIWSHFLGYRPALSARVRSYEIPGLYDRDNSKEMVGNLYYATAMCRTHYWSRKPPLPHEDDIEGLGAYWKEHYNTPLGKGTVGQFVKNYARYVAA